VYVYCLYPEYHSVCPLVRIGTPPPPSPASECVPPGTNGREHTRLRVRGGGPNSDDWRKSLALCLLCVGSLAMNSCARVQGAQFNLMI
jgi:hypothetical protein